MKALFTIIAIIAFFIVLLSVKFSVIVHCDEGISLDVIWLFVRLHILPWNERSKILKRFFKKKEKKPEIKKEVNAECDEEDKKETGKKSPNIFVKFYRNNGLNGFIELLRNLEKSLKSMFGRIIKAFIIDDLFISILVGAGDSAETAIKFGKICSSVYPPLGFITSTMKVHKQKCEIVPDFISGNNATRVHAKISVVPRRLINACIIVAFNIFFNVVIKLFRGSKEKNATETDQNNK